MPNQIIIVDDNEEILDVFKDLFSNTNVKPVCFSNVIDAKLYLKKDKNVTEIKAIISDLMMAPTDGLDFLSYVKSKPELAKIDFYLITGAAVTVFEPFLRPFSLKGVITKPFNPQALLSVFTKTNQESTNQKAA